MRQDNLTIPWDKVQFVADLHIHSKYSRATSQEMTPRRLNQYAKMKGIKVMGTGDFTHPLYLKELEEALEKAPDGFYCLKDDPQGTRFCLSAEISNIFSWHGKTHRIHTVIIVSDLKEAQNIQAHLRRLGNVSSDGRPIFGFPAKDLVRIVRESSDNFLIIPAHIWTPWFSLFGAKSGFDSIEECFEEETEHIYALETGLSSDPPMNWMWSALDRFTLVSNSDAHSPQKIGREANCFSCELDLEAMFQAIREPQKGFLGTIEFFPEEGKYHWDGHRLCGVALSPKETMRLGGLCPKCGKPLTVGVMHRVLELSDRDEGTVPDGALPFEHLIPLSEVLQEALGVKSFSKRVRQEYERIVKEIAPEIDVLCRIPIETLKGVLSEKLIQGILNMREGRVDIMPGHDGEYGIISLYGSGSKDGKKRDTKRKGRKKAHQKTLF